MLIKTLNNRSAVCFASSELERYIKEMQGDTAGGEIMLGLYGDFADLKHKNNEKEDSFVIKISAGSGFIAASNPRSVLYGVYTYLKKLGCSWVRPGKDGEYIPKVDVAEFDVEVKEKASYNYRGMCIGGAVSIENVIEQVDWAAKVGYNRLFMELVDPTIFFEKWYNHTLNPTKKPEGITQEQIKGYMDEISAEIQKRGMLFQRAGHGFMCEPFGINVKDWGKTAGEDFAIDDEIKGMLAEINGVRGLHRNIPMVTNFCMSNPEARSRVVNYVTEYAKDNPDIKEIHFWLADGYDNHCECDECKKAVPTDFYITILNELDAEWTKQGIDTKIVALMYVELLWPPIREKLKNPERFLMMYCPITRSNAVSYKAEDPYSRDLFIPEFKRNGIDWPMSAAENFAFLKEWQKNQTNIQDYFEFSYHFYWRGYTDYGFYNTARNICEDVQYLKKAGLDGMISCQFTRNYFPTGLGLYALAEILWNRNVDFEDIAADYLKLSFGEGWQFVKKYLATLSEVGEYTEHRYPQDVPMKYIKKRCQWVREFIDATVSERTRYNGKSEAEEASWRYLNLHAEFLVLYTQLIEALDEKSYVNSKKALDALMEYLGESEDKIQPVFDVAKFLERYIPIVENLK